MVVLSIVHAIVTPPAAQSRLRDKYWQNASVAQDSDQLLRS
jgi:hypothetical protein